MSTAQPVRIRDVARLAGVSIGTVSNVLNGRSTVNEDLSRRVNDAIDKLGYVPSDTARQLSTGHSKSLGLLVRSSYNSFFNALADAAEDEAEARGHTLLLGGSSQRPDREAKYLDLFQSQRVRGVLIAPINGVTDRIRRLHDQGMAVVLLGEKGPTDEFCSVQTDTEAGGFLAVQHLAQQGRRDILVVGGPEAVVSDRLAGAARATAAEGVRMSYMSTDDLSIEHGRRAASRILNLDPADRPDGIFAVNDFVAIGVQHELAQHGVSIPADISMVGHDDIDFAASALVPLTTIRQPLPEMAAAAVSLCLREADEGVDHEHRAHTFTPELVERHSSMPRRLTSRVATSGNPKTPA